LPGQRAIAFPIKTLQGDLDGLVTLNRLAQLAPEERSSRRVRDVGTAMADVPKASPDEQVTAVLERFPQSDDGQMLVIDGGKLVGTLSSTDVTRALRLRRVSS